MVRLAIFLAALLGATPAWAERCALIDKGNIIEWTQTKSSECPPDPGGKGWDWRPAPVVARPVYDPAVQVLSGPTYTVGPTEITEVWTLRDKTAQELADDKAAADSARLSQQQGTGILRFTASVTIGSVAGAAFTDKTFTVTGLLATDLVLGVAFPSGLTPATIGYIPLRVSADNTLIVRFFKIASGAVTPPTPQNLTVVVLR
jgi:hypothetical protein